MLFEARRVYKLTFVFESEELTHLKNGLCFKTTLVQQLLSDECQLYS